MIRLVSLALVLGALLSFAAPARAQAPGPSAAPDTAQLDALIQTIEDPAARAKLVEQLRTLQQAQRSQEPPPEEAPARIAQSVLEILSDRVSDAGETVFRAAAFVSDTARLYGWAREQFGDADLRARYSEILGKLLLVFIAGWTLEFIVTRLLGYPRTRIEARPGGDEWTRIPYALFYALLHAAPIAAFGAAAIGALSLAEPSRPARLMALGLVNAGLIVRVAALLAILLLAPRAPGVRLLPVRDETAHYGLIWTSRLTAAVAYGYFIAAAALLMGAPAASHLFLLKLVGVLVALLLIVLILQNRANVAVAIEAGDSKSGLRHLIAAYWHVPAIVFVAAVLLFWFVRPDEGFVFVVRAMAATAIACVMALVARRLVIHGLARAFRVSDDASRRFPALEERVNRYLKLFNGVAIAAIYVFTAFAVLQAWGLRSFDWLGSPDGQRTGAGIGVVGVTLIVSLVAWESVSVGLSRYVTTRFGGEYDRRRARGRTLVRLVQRMLFIVLAAFVALVAMSEIGIDIAPLLAGAGVVGLAFGLGAQTMIKNLIEGVANVLEDSFAVGDVVTIAERSGVIEEISMRAVRLRDYNGHVHTVPFSEIKTVTNMTRDYAYAVLDITVDFDEDTDRVIEILKHEAAELRKDPEIGRMIAGDLEIAGVDQFGNGVTIKSRLQAFPAIKQWDVQRALNRRLNIAFSREGIMLNTAPRNKRTLGPQHEEAAVEEVEARPSPETPPAPPTG